ncbi:aldo/keto reductase [Xylariaceae sp. FL0804]|nr:aldo/keto reductase [Xylariaceae sp. FL0804]
MAIITAASVARHVEFGLKKKTPSGQDSGYQTPEDAPPLPTVQLNDGNEIPQIALGVYKAPNSQETEDAVTAALDAGYRHIDSAARYANEEACGRALQKWLQRTGVPRSEVFITTKLWDADHGYEATLNALCASLERFQLDYFDLYLLHSPAECRHKRLASWRALETARRLGKVHSIGVSNFGAAHLDELLAAATVVPAVNQVEVHPFCRRRALVDKCRRHGIVVQAYSPLARGNKLRDPRVAAVAAAHDRSPAQVLINWSVRRGNVVLPKSLTAHRIRSNLESLDFQLSQADMAVLDGLDENYVTGSLHRSND